MNDIKMVFFYLLHFIIVKLSVKNGSIKWNLVSLFIFIYLISIFLPSFYYSFIKTDLFGILIIIG